MANEYTDKLKLAKPAAGDLSWDDEIHRNTNKAELLFTQIILGNGVVDGGE